MIGLSDPRQELAWCFPCFDSRLLRQVSKPQGSKQINLLDLRGGGSIQAMSPQKVRVLDGWTCRAGPAQLRGGYHPLEEDSELSQLSEYLGLSYHLGHPSSDMSGTNESQVW